MHFKIFFSLFCLLLCQMSLLSGQQDSLLGFAATHEAYRNISMEKKKMESDKEFIEPLEVTMIQNEVLEDGQALLEYFISDSKICVFFISKNEFKKQIIQKDFPLEAWVDVLTNNLSSPNFDNPDFEKNNAKFVELSHLIYEKIFAPLEAFGLPERLLIKPDGVLKKLPFEIFLTEKPTDDTDFENHDYLFQTYKISYCHSTAAQQKMRKASPLAPKLFMTFAPDSYENVQFEAITIYRKFGGDIYQEETATAGILQEEASLFQALHFPHICEDAIADLPNLNANLVVFSNCKSIENAFPVVQQFAEKGAKSMVTDLWKTTPETRLDFMKNFYHHIYQKKDKDAAMQRAKKDAVSWTSGVEGHPHFWANHVVFGVTKSVDLQGFRYDWWLWGGLVLLLLLGVVFIDRNII